MNETTAQILRRQTRFWLFGLGFLIVFLWLFSEILLPFLAGMVLAYFLDPVADLLERWKISRLWATIIILVTILIAFVLILMLVIPVLGNQLAAFIENIPHLISRLQNLVLSFKDTWLGNYITIDEKTISENLDKVISNGAKFLSGILSRLWQSGQSLVSLISLLVVTPVVAFYMLYDWDRMVAKVDSWLPLDQRGQIRQIFRDIDIAIAGFVRGQGSLCLILGLFYGASLSLAGLNFGLLIGLVSGLISFIPYVGSLTGLILSVGVALVQFWPEYVPILIVALIFGFGQFLEGNILQPKLVGDSIGLHPVWLMFALFAFGTLFGFTGMLVAVPAAAAVGVIVRFGLDWYLQSELYHGHSASSRPSPAKAKIKAKTKRRSKS